MQWVNQQHIHYLKRQNKSTWTSLEMLQSQTTKEPNSMHAKKDTFTSKCTSFQ